MASNLDYIEIVYNELERPFTSYPGKLARHLTDRYTLVEGSRILEVGCGPGMLWRKNLDRIHPEWRVCLADFSPGMIRTAQSHILPVHPHFTTAGLDIQHIPFSEASFDVIIANHMLYHVPDHPKAFGEIRRLLKPGGRFYASTNGQTHLQEMGELVTRFNPKCNNWGNRISTMSFTLENLKERICGTLPSSRLTAGGNWMGGHNPSSRAILLV